MVPVLYINIKQRLSMMESDLIHKNTKNVFGSDDLYRVINITYCDAIKTSQLRAVAMDIQYKFVLNEANK